MYIYLYIPTYYTFFNTKTQNVYWKYLLVFCCNNYASPAKSMSKSNFLPGRRKKWKWAREKIIKWIEREAVLICVFKPFINDHDHTINIYHPCSRNHRSPPHIYRRGVVSIKSALRDAVIRITCFFQYFHLENGTKN